MAFSPRTFEQILNDMIAYMQANTAISDYNVGSVIRTILEAAALEDDEQYFQMVQLLDMFSYTTASGEDLDRRLGDFGLTRNSAKAATTRLQFFDNNLIRTKAAQNTPASSTSIVGFDTSRFPTTGYPYTIRVGEGTPRLQNLLVLLNDPTTMTLTLSGSTTFAVEIGDRIAFVTGGTLASPVPPSATARTINTGAQVQAPPTVAEAARLYTTSEPAFIIQGNYASNEVVAKCTTSGTAGNVSANRINQFSSSPPFIGAGVTNVTEASGGLDRETDSQFRTRALNRLQSLSRGTPLALKTSAIGVQDPVTSSSVVSSNIVEDFTNHEVILYIDDGTGSAAKTKILSADSLFSSAASGTNTLTLVDASDWPNNGWVFIETDGTHASELIHFMSKLGNVLTLDTNLTLTHNAASIVDFVDLVTDSAEVTQRRFQLNNFPVVGNTERIWTKAPAGLWVLLVRDVDYILNKGTGEVQLTNVGGVVAGTEMIAHYIYYTNLIAQVQKVMEGDPADAANFPGVKAAGVFLTVQEPVIKRITVTANISAAEGFNEIDLAPTVQTAIESYISSLRIGEDVITAKIVEAAISVNGVSDVHVLVPAANVVVLESELPIPFNASGVSLVQVL